METASEQLADWVANLEYRNIPPDIIQSARSNILDMLGCGLFGSSLPWVKVISTMVKDWGGKEEASLWGHGKKVPCVNAVFANTNAVNSFEFDDTYFPTGIHPGALVVTSALASAEYIGGGVSGSGFIEAVVAGHEVSIRVRNGLGWSVLHGWNGTAICSTFGAAAASAKVLGLRANQIADALGITGPSVGGLLTYGFKAMAKRLVNARAAQGGVMAALLAKKGVTGYKDILESKQGGFCTAHSSDPTTDKITENLGEVYEMRKMALKKYPNCTSFHAVVDALSEVTTKHTINATEVEKVIIHTTQGAQKNNVGITYDNIHSAQMSMQYAVAVKVVDGKVGVEQFSEKKIQDDRIRDMAKRVEIQIDPELDSLGLDHRLSARVDVVFKNGSILKSNAVRNPKRMSLKEANVKFTDLASRVINEDRVREILGFIESLETVSDITDMVELIVT
ncbi:MAG: MmgE/PrpD family protein [Candidatus Hodarchaeales archaeon]